MLGSAVLDTTIGLIAFYIAFALLVSRAQEWIAGRLNTRGRVLFDGIVSLIGSDAACKLYGSYLIATMARPEKKSPSTQNSQMPLPAVPQAGMQTAPPPDALKPANISPRRFALALIDTVNRQLHTASGGLAVEPLPTPPPGAPPVADAAKTGGDNKIDQAFVAVSEAVSKLDERLYPELKPQLLRMLHDAQGSYDAFAENIENWFNDQMDRVSGWYKRHATTNMWIISIAVVLIFNVDTIFIAKMLFNNPNFRSHVIGVMPTPAPAPAGGRTSSAAFVLRSAYAGAPELAQTATQATAPPNPCAVQMGLAGQGEKNPLAIPIGWNALTNCEWSDKPDDNWGRISFIALKAIGLFVSVVAVVQGAPFWFQLLDQIMNVRYSGPVSTKTAQDARVTGVTGA